MYHLIHSALIVSIAVLVSAGDFHGGITHGADAKSYSKE